MKRAPRRGHALLLVLSILTALGISAAVVLQRLGSEAGARQQEEARTQLRWLARSAALRGEPGTFDVDVTHGRARVRVHRRDGETVAEAALPGYGVARTTNGTRGVKERYERETVGAR